MQETTELLGIAHGKRSQGWSGVGLEGSSAGVGQYHVCPAKTLAPTSPGFKLWLWFYQLWPWASFLSSLKGGQRWIRPWRRALCTRSTAQAVTAACNKRQRKSSLSCGAGGGARRLNRSGGGGNWRGMPAPRETRPGGGARQMGKGSRARWPASLGRSLGLSKPAFVRWLQREARWRRRSGGLIGGPAAQLPPRGPAEARVGRAPG